MMMMLEKLRVESPFPPHDAEMMMMLGKSRVELPLSRQLGVCEPRKLVPSCNGTCWLLLQQNLYIKVTISGPPSRNPIVDSQTEAAGIP